MEPCEGSLCQRATTAHEPDDEQHDRDDEEEVKDRADRERPDEAQQPGDQQNDGDRIQHGDLSLARANHLGLTTRAEVIRDSYARQSAAIAVVCLCV